MKISLANILAVMILFVLGQGIEVQAGNQERELKAAFVYNFAKFTDWPAKAFPGAGSPFVICLVGSGSLAEALRALEGRSVKGHSIEVKNLLSPEEAKRCHLLFIGNADKRQASQIIAAARGQNVLTVGDEVENFLSAGGMINLVTVDDKIRFEINVRAAQQADLQISSQLLKLAMSVKE
jgi:hypothetical protein